MSTDTLPTITVAAEVPYKRSAFQMIQTEHTMDYAFRFTTRDPQDVPHKSIVTYDYRHKNIKITPAETADRLRHLKDFEYGVNCELEIVKEATHEKVVLACERRQNTEFGFYIFIAGIVYTIRGIVKWQGHYEFASLED